MSDPLNPWEDEDRLPPAGDLNADTPGLTGMINTMGGGSMIDSGGTMGGTAERAGTATPSSAPAPRSASPMPSAAAAGGVGDTGRPSPRPGSADTDPGPDANDLEADNAVEQETIETVDPANPPALSRHRRRDTGAGRWARARRRRRG